MNSQTTVYEIWRLLHDSAKKIVTFTGTPELGDALIDALYKQEQEGADYELRYGR